MQKVAYVPAKGSNYPYRVRKSLITRHYSVVIEESKS